MLTTQPWDNDRAADWFGDLFQASKLEEIVTDTLSKKISTLEEAEVGRAAIFMFLTFGRISIWPVDDIDEVNRMAIQRIKEILRLESNEPIEPLLRMELEQLEMRANGALYADQDPQLLKILQQWYEPRQADLFDAGALLPVQNYPPELQHECRPPDLQRECRVVELASVIRLFKRKKSGLYFHQLWQSPDNVYVYLNGGKVGKDDGVIKIRLNSGTPSAFFDREISLYIQDGYKIDDLPVTAIQIQPDGQTEIDFAKFQQEILRALMRSGNVKSLNADEDKKIIECSVYDVAKAKKSLAGLLDNLNVSESPKIEGS